MQRNDAARAEALATDAPAGLYEVMIDTFGDNPMFLRGHLLSAEDVAAAGFDLEHAVARGHVREAPEYVGTGLRSTTQPFEGQPRGLPFGGGRGEAATSQVGPITRESEDAPPAPVVIEDVTPAPPSARTTPSSRETASTRDATPARE